MLSQVTNQLDLRRSLPAYPMSGMATTVAIYIVEIGAIEVTLAYISPLIGAILHALLVLLLLCHYVMSEDEVGRRALLLLVLVPMLRLFSLTMPLRNAHHMYWYLLSGLPLLLAAGVLAYRLWLSLEDIGLKIPANWQVEVTTAAYGLPLSVVGYWLMEPRALVATVNAPKLLVAAVCLIIFVGFTEELVFRGLLHKALAEVYGDWSLLWSSLLFASVYIGTLSIPFVLFMAGVGFLFGWCRQRTDSIWGVAAAHSIFVIGAKLVFPLLLG